MVRFPGPELATVILQEEAAGEAIVRHGPLTRNHPDARATRASTPLARLRVATRGLDHATTHSTSLAVSVRR